MEKRLFQIAAFYKNDKPGGIGISIDTNFGDLDDMLFILQASYNAMWAECQANGSLADLINDLRAQLVEIGLKKDAYGLDTVATAIGNIWLLENRGLMVTDEFNGLQLIYMRET